jgi:RimJ/RimL family protein N-acetyltransferase
MSETTIAAAPPRVLQTERLVLRELQRRDASFILALVNEPSWLRFIGDKGVRTLEDAVNYIAEGPARMYARHGFGLWLVELREGSAPVGLCGLVKRESLPDVDVGFAFLSAHWCNGYAFESATAVVSYARDVLGLRRIVAIASPDNDRSARLLAKLGFRYERRLRLPGAADLVALHAIGA